MRRVATRWSVGAAIVAGVIGGGAGPVWAHIDPDPVEAQAGSEVSVGFTVEHGCEDSPTIRLAMRLPDGVTGAVAEPPPGWSGSVDANVVTFDGGVLPGDAKLTFRVRMVLPATPDVSVFFPFVQYCEVGEIRWIDVPSDGSGAELDEPAPAMRLFGPVVTTTTTSAAVSTVAPTTAPATTVAAEPTSVAPTTVPVASMQRTVPTTVKAPPVVESSVAQSPVDDAADTAAGGGGGRVGVFVFAGVLVALAAMAAVVVRASRRALAGRS